MKYWQVTRTFTGPADLGSWTHTLHTVAETPEKASELLVPFFARLQDSQGTEEDWMVQEEAEEYLL